MKFKELDAKMRHFETPYDLMLPSPEEAPYIVVRLDGRGFTKLTKSAACTKPFDDRFHAAMIRTTAELMVCGFKVMYAYTQSDEISLLIDGRDDAYNRKGRKWLSILAGTASSVFSHVFHRMAVFDSRVIPLANWDSVVAYFRWRQEDARRNAVNGYVYYGLRSEGYSGHAASKKMEFQPYEDKLEYIKQKYDAEKIMPWHMNGTGMYWKTYEKASVNPQTNEIVNVSRTKQWYDENLPTRHEYEAYLKEIVDGWCTANVN